MFELTSSPLITASLKKRGNFFSAALLAVSFFAAQACSTDARTGNSDASSAEEAPAPEAVKHRVTEIASGLSHPWGMAFLPEGGMLVTERSGHLRMLDTDHNLSEPLKGVPEVFAKGQGGMLDVAIDPDFSENRMVYLSFSEPGKGKEAGTALGRGKLTDQGIEDFQVIFRQEPKAEGGIHFGSRIVFHEGHLYLTLGERNRRDLLQDLSVHLGTIVRINPDGSVPADNPFAGREGAREEIWSYGHRNVQGADIDPATGLLWVSEMGPLHGDELNLVKKAENYGWPEVSWGNEYNGDPIPDHDTRDEFVLPVTYWEPSIAPSGMTFYTGSVFPQWEGYLFIGGLQSMGLVVVKVTGESAEEVDRIDLEARTRDVKQAPDGSLYVLTDEGNGRVLRIHAQ